MSSGIYHFVRWARDRGMRAMLGDECVVRSHESDRLAVLEDLVPLDGAPTINFGRWQEVVPGAVVAPTSEDDLVAIVAELSARGLGHASRGRGHCSGDLGLARAGEVLVELSCLSRVAPLAAPQDSLAIAASATLGDLVAALATLGRRPLGLTTNLAQSIGGTIAVGGFTESCHLHGLFADAAMIFRVVTPAGELVEVSPGDPRFDMIPGGSGKHGVVTAVALRSAVGRLRADVRMLRWRCLEEFLPDALRIAQLRLYGYFRPRLVQHPEFEVDALVGNYVADDTAATPADSGRAFLHPASETGIERLDLEAALRAATLAPKRFACPAVELVFPFPAEADRAIAFARGALSMLAPHLPRGIALALAPGGSSFPHIPLPPSGWGLMIAVRPELPPRAAAALVPSLRALFARTLDGSNALRYQASI